MIILRTSVSQAPGWLQ